MDAHLQNGQLPLGCCACFGWAAVASELLEQCANVNAVDGEGLTPLHYAVMFRETEVTQVCHEQELYSEQIGLHDVYSPVLCGAV